jgi:hypothetical protein
MIKQQIVHLFRGSPAVRSWSKHPKTVTGWTLCGINRQLAFKNNLDRVPSSEDPALVSCERCRELMAPTDDRQMELFPGGMSMVDPKTGYFD